MRFVLAVVAASVAWPAAGADVSFRRDVSAVLARAGCSAGACHGNLNGKGGLRLSLRGEDPAADYLTLTRDQFGRRIDVSDPAASLLLRKAAGQTPHEGGVRFTPSSPEYRVLRDWVKAGAADDRADLPGLVGLAVTPPRTVALDGVDRVRLKAVATYADGSTRDVTGLVAVDLSTVGVARVTPAGELVREKAGEVVALVRYLSITMPVRVAFLPDRPAVDLAAFPVTHPVDKLAVRQWTALRLRPTDVAPDGVFLRRVTLDTTGLTPTADEVRAFAADTSVGKRERVVDELLGRPAFAAYWGQKWADLLRVEEKSLDRKGVQVFHRWIRDQIAADRPLADLAREVLAGRGSTYESPPANFYRAVREPYARAEAVAQVFLGLRVGCAKCHNHPFDRWTQDDYHAFAAVFARVDYRVGANGRRDNLDKHEFVGEQVVYQVRDRELPHPRGGVAKPRLLGTPAELSPDADRLAGLAGWVADPANPYFARAQANRVWLHLLGRGLVDPADDFRATNPASDPALLDHLAAEFARGGYRLKPLVRHILTSRVYALDSAANDTTAGDDHHFARAVPQPLEAEQLLDAVGRVLDSPVKFPGYPAGTRAGEVPATPQTPRRGGGPEPGLRFLKVFGKPDRLLTCECERADDPGLVQAFQLMTGDVVQAALRAPDNRIGKLLRAGTADDAILDELYLLALARTPTTEERAAVLKHVRGGDRRAGWEDVAWGLVNAKEFQVRR